jgi:hypothetical protein
MIVLNFYLIMWSPDEWSLIAPMNVKRSRVALTANNGKLYAIGKKTV